MTAPNADPEASALRRLRLALRRTGSRQVPGRTIGPPAGGEGAAEASEVAEVAANGERTRVAAPARSAKSSRPGGRRGPRSQLRRRVGSAVRMSLALLIVGGLYAGFAPGMQAAANQEALSSQTDAEKGKAIYDASCISCHGRN